MPIYEYRCANAHTFEVLRSMSEGPVVECERCGAPVERVFHPVAVHFKGSGFYTTDYARKGAKAGGESAGKADQNGGEAKSGKDSKPASEKAGSGSSEKSGKGSTSE